MRNLRVLEVGSSVAAAYCGRLFASTGAEVVCLEPPEGAALRRSQPRVPGHDDVSASWAYLAAGKRSAVLPTDDAELDALLTWADLVIDAIDGDPGAAATWQARIAAVNPAAVHVAISGFGLTGPYAGYRSTALTDWAAGGHMSLTGEPDREPLQGGGAWDSYLTGATAAVGAQAALFHAARTGEGQLVDVGAIEAAAALHQWSITMYTHTGVVKKRWGNRFAESVHPIALYLCKDGWISIVAPALHQWEASCIVMDMVDLLADDRLRANAERFDRADEIDARINAWLEHRTCDEAVAALQAAGVPASRLMTMSQVLDEPQLELRQFLTTPDDLGAGARMPGAPFRVGDRRIEPTPAPALGEHSDEVRADARRPAPRVLPALDLHDVTVLEMGVAWAGPFVGRMLGDLGVDVIKVEHPTSRGIGTQPERPPGWHWGELPDPQVRYPVYPEAIPGERWWNRGGLFNKMNRSKRSLCLDGKAGDGPEILRSLIAKADLVLHNYSPRGARSLGIDVDSVRRSNPDAVTISMTGYGTDGPLAANLSYGPVLQAHGGFDEATGYEGGGPTRIGVAYPDAVGGLHGSFAALAALWERELVDEAVHVDISQLETLLSIAGDMLLVTSLTGVDPARHGNRSPQFSPQGAYPAQGEDRWLAVTVQSDDEWTRLVDLVGDERLVARRSLDHAGRAADADAIDEALAAWTIERSGLEAAAGLQGIGVAAFPVMTNGDLVDDPHIAERGFIATWDQPDVGPARFPGFPIHFSRTQISLGPCPALGADNAAVLAELLGYDDEHVARLLVDGVIADRPPG